MLNGNLDAFGWNTSKSGAQHRLSALKHLADLKFDFSARVQSGHVDSKLRSLRYRRALHRRALQLNRLSRHRQTQKARSRTRSSWSKHRRRICKTTLTTTTWITTAQGMSTHTTPIRTMRQSKKGIRQASTSRLGALHIGSTEDIGVRIDITSRTLRKKHQHEARPVSSRTRSSASSQSSQGLHRRV